MSDFTTKMSKSLPQLGVNRIDKVLYGPKIDLNIDPRGLGKYLHEEFTKHADSIFQIDAATGEEETYATVNQKCIRFALELKTRGIQKNDVVLVCVGNSMDSVVPVLATIYINVINVTLDPSISLRDTAHLLKLVRPKLILVEQNSVDLIECASRQANFNTEIVVIGSSDKYSTYADFLQPKSKTMEDNFVPANVDDVKNTAAIFFSSGTTGLPKGIEISHYSMIYMVEMILLGYGNFTSAMHFTSFYWMTAIIITFMVIKSGGRKIVTKNYEAETALSYIERYKIGIIFLPPSYTYTITEDLVKKYPCPDLCQLLLAGGGISTEQYKKLRNYFPNSMVTLIYAQTETGGSISAFSLATYTKFKDKLTSSGLPCPNVVLRIVDPNTEEVLGPNEKGEIRVKTPAACNGYYNQDSSDMHDKDGYIKTGDIGYYDTDNCIHICDRIKDMFKYQSWHIVPMSLENVLHEHPAIFEAIVIGIPQEVDGHIPMALVVLKEGANTVTEDELLRFANSKLTEREQLRGGLRIVKNFPRGVTGKISRKYMTDLVINGQLQKLV